MSCNAELTFGRDLVNHIACSTNKSSAKFCQNYMYQHFREAIYMYIWGEKQFCLPSKKTMLKLNGKLSSICLMTMQKLNGKLSTCNICLIILNLIIFDI